MGSIGRGKPFNPRERPTIILSRFDTTNISRLTANPRENPPSQPPVTTPPLPPRPPRLLRLPLLPQPLFPMALRFPIQVPPILRSSVPNWLLCAPSTLIRCRLFQFLLPLFALSFTGLTVLGRGCMGAGFRDRCCGCDCRLVDAGRADLE